MGLTSDRNDPRLGHGVDKEETDQHEVYLVAPEEELKEGEFIRPVRRSYVHVGAPGPQYPLRDLDEEQLERYGDTEYVKYEEYPEEGRPALGRFWTQEQLDNIGKGCGVETTMNQKIAETYAKYPAFYGATYCMGCRKHLPVGVAGEFVWSDTEERVGT